MAVLLAPALAPAQIPAGAAPDPTPPIVEEIAIEYRGARNVSRQAILGYILLEEGKPFSQALADRSIRALYDSGNFDFIQLRREPTIEDRIRVVFDVKAKLRVRKVVFEGNDDVDDDDLEDEIETAPGLPLDRVQIKSDSVAIFDYLQKKGYANARVSYEVIETDEGDALGTVVFRIDEGERLKIKKIRFEGNDSISDRQLRKQMETSRYWLLWSWLTGSGRLIEEEFEDDLQKLRDYYKDQGFLDVEIRQSDVELQRPKEGRLEIVINVTENRRYRVGNVDVEGNELFEANPLLVVLNQRPGKYFSPTAIEESIENLRDFYGSYGYLDTFVRVERTPNIDTGLIDLNFVITEGSLVYVNTINIEGNTKTKSEVIVRETALMPGDVFDLVRMKTSEARLRNTRFFEHVNLAPEATNIPGRRNLRITVKEGRTGNLQFGAGFSNIESIVAIAEFQQSNFDLWNHRNWFQGGGQKFRIRVTYGARSSSLVLGYEEPWVFNRRLAFGFELFRRSSDFLATTFNEVRLGTELFLRKRLFELVNGRLSYLIEQVRIKDVSANASPVIQQEEGTRLTSKPGFQLSRDTRDRLFWTTRGSRVTAAWDVAGLGGDTFYVNQEYRIRKFFPIFSDPFEQTLELQWRGGTVFPYNDDTVPFFDRYFLGGPFTLRGFGFRDVGPKERNGSDNVGGQSMFFSRAEYTVRFFDPFGLAFFYDGGFVNADAFDFGFGNYNDNWGIGARIDVLGAPLNVDFGFPLTTDEFNDGGVQFNFSFGTVF